MKCEAVRAQFHRYVDGEADACAQLQVEGHTRECASCARELAALQQLAAVTSGSLPQLTAPDGFQEAVLAAVSVGAGRRESAGPRWVWPQWVAGAGRPLRYAAWAAALGVAAYSVYVANLEQLAGERRMVVLGQSTLAWGAPASLRVVAYASRDNQEPLAGEPVVLQARRAGGLWWHTLYRGRTNAAGSVDAAFRLPKDLEGRCILRVKSGGLLAPDELEQPITVERKARVLLSTDKPLYQPGQSLHLRVLAMDLGARTAAADRPVTLEVKDPKGTKVFRREVQTSRFGIASVDFQLAELVQHGRYQIVARVGEDEIEKTVEVHPYVLPKFRVDVKTDRTYYAPGDVLSGTVQADYFFGKPVTASRVRVRLAAFDTEFHTFASVTGQTDGRGRFSFRTRLPESFAGHPLQQGDALVRLGVEVTDATGHLEETAEHVPVAEKPFRISIVPEGSQPAWGLENRFYLVSSYPDGTVARVSGTVRDARSTYAFRTDATGIAVVTVPVGQVDLQLSVAAVDTRGQQVTEERKWFFNGMQVYDRNTGGMTSPGSVLLRTDAALYQVGGTLTAEVLTSGASSTLYLDVARGGQTVLTRSVEAQNGRARFVLDLSDDLTGTLTLHAYSLTTGGAMVRDTRLVIVRPSEGVRVAVEPSKESYRPGEEGKLRLRLTDAEGRPAPGAIGLTAVDESVYALREQDVALERDYFAMERAIMEPRYQDKFFLPPAFQPARVLEGPGAQERAAVSLACLAGGASQPAPGNEDRYRGGQSVESPGSEAAVPRFTLALNTGPKRVTALREYQQSYFRGLSWLVMLLALLASTLLIVRRNAWGLLVSAPLFALVFWYASSPFAAPTLSAVVAALVVPVALGYSRGIFGLGGMLLSTAMVGFVAAILLPVFAPAREAARKDTPSLAMRELATTGGAPAGAPAAAMGQFAQDYDAVAASSPAAGEPPRLRQYFPETLFWQPEVITDDRGEVEVPIRMADSITTWRLSAVGSTADGRIGSTSTGLRVFQDFFLDLDLPVTLTQHDEITLPVAVHNYLPNPQTIRIELKAADWFRLRGPRVRSVTLEPNAVGVVRFPITALHFGKHFLEVTGKGEKLADAVRREIEVLPDGEEVVRSEGDRLQGELTRPVTFAAGSIPGTERLLLKLYPGTFSQVLEGLDGLLKVPYG